MWEKAHDFYSNKTLLTKNRWEASFGSQVKVGQTLTYVISRASQVPDALKLLCS